MKVLIIDKVHEELLSLLSELNIHVEYEPNITRSEILAKLSKYEGLVVRSKTPVNEELLATADKLIFVARAGAGVDNVDLEALKKRNIILINAPEGNRDALAEHAIGMLLSMINNLNQADQQIRNGVWDREGNRGVELKGKTVGLIGYGHMGEAFAQRLTSFGCTILAYDSERKNFSSPYVQEVTLATLQKETEILSLHIPMNMENKGLINKDFLNRFTKLKYLINTSRGEVLILKDLIDLIRNGAIQGAALDVLENERINELNKEEQVVFQELIQLPQVILSPHIAGWTHESYQKISQVLGKKIKALVEKKDLM